MKKKYSIGVLVLLGLMICFGFILIFADASDINRVVFTILGLGLILFSLPGIIAGFGLNDNELKSVFITSVLLLVGGIVMLFKPGTLVSIIFGCFFIIIPIVNLVFAENKKARALVDLPKYIIGILIILFSVEALLGVLYTIVGIFLILGGLSLLITYLTNKDDFNYFSYAFHNDHSKIDGDIIEGKAEEKKN